MTQPRGVNWSRVLVYGLLPALVLLLAIAAGLLKWKDSSVRNTELARSQSVAAARDSAVALLSFRFDTVDRDVAAARERLTGEFRDTYTQRTQEELIPNAKERHVSATASVPGAGGPPDGPIALCLHGFPDTAYGWRNFAPRLAESGWRVVAPFMRGYAPSSIPSDGSYHIGALMDDALQVRSAAGGTDRDVVIGHDWGAMAANGLAAMPDSPFAKAVIMSVPPAAAFRGRVPEAGRLLAQIPP